MVLGLHALYNLIAPFMRAYGYGALFILMALESSSLPVPSEVVLPLAGALAHSGTFRVYIAFAVSVLGSLVGSAVDFYIGYAVSKEAVYSHLGLFHIKRKTLEAFDRWFDRNAVPAVLLSRLVPVVRTFMSFPAGFARMSLKRFFALTAAGCAVWNAVLIAFGYYLVAVGNVTTMLAAVGVFAIGLYLVYRLAMRRMAR